MNKNISYQELSNDFSEFLQLFNKYQSAVYQLNQTRPEKPLENISAWNSIFEIENRIQQFLNKLEEKYDKKENKL